jgi:hypothetical protein
VPQVRTGALRRMNWSVHGKEASERGELTACRAQREGLVREWKEAREGGGAHTN